MLKIQSFVLVLLISSTVMGQAIGKVDKKTKEFTVPANLKTEYRFFGYQYANPSTQKMICFSSRVADVKDNYNRCPLGSYFDTEKIKYGDKIVYLGPIGSFGKMNYIAGDGKKTIFYLPKTNFTIR